MTVPFINIADGMHYTVLAMGAPPGAGVNPYVQFIPIVLVFAIFYFIILLPTQRRQKKVQAFLDTLKVGDRVVTTGGIYGSVTKVDGQTVQLQIADKVRVELSKSAIVGFQGQDPVADRTS
jgi:preprotein translocase subunit YajC